MIKNMINNKNTKGITLIALIITIVVMLILVVVSIQIALETGLFESAGKATKNWEEAQDKEAELGSGKVTIGGVTYNSIGEYTNSIKTEENEEVDFEKLFATAEKHPDQSAENNDIGIAEDGSIVNMDLWYYEIILNGSYPEGYRLGEDMVSAGQVGYYGDIIEGKIIGQVPMYIKEGNGDFFPVLLMECTFENCISLTEAPAIPSSVTNMRFAFARCSSLIKAPVIPNSVTDMEYTFSSCTSLTEAPIIPSSVTSMRSTFSGCTSLTKAPAIPTSVTNMKYTFEDCTSLTEAPEIPSLVTYMFYTFNGCTSLTGTLTINANPTDYSGCLENAATNEGCNLVLNGSSTVLNEILATKSANSNISLGS